MRPAGRAGAATSRRCAAIRASAPLFPGPVPANPHHQAPLRLRSARAVPPTNRRPAGRARTSALGPARGRDQQGRHRSVRNRRRRAVAHRNSRRPEARHRSRRPAPVPPRPRQCRRRRGASVGTRRRNSPRPPCPKNRTCRAAGPSATPRRRRPGPVQIRVRVHDRTSTGTQCHLERWQEDVGELTRADGDGRQVPPRARRGVAYEVL